MQHAMHITITTMVNCCLKSDRQLRWQVQEWHLRCLCIGNVWNIWTYGVLVSTKYCNTRLSNAATGLHLRMRPGCMTRRHPIPGSWSNSDPVGSTLGLSI